MKKYILFFGLLVFACLGANAQESFTLGNPNRDFYWGKELFLQHKYTASMSILERFVKAHPHADESVLQEAAYYIASDAYELRKENAKSMLKEYLLNYPHTQFADRVYMMLGNLLTEDKKYTDALAWYAKADENHLDSIGSATLAFNKGYAYVQAEDYGKAKTAFGKLKSRNTKYKTSATYYYAYSEYALKNYDAALSNFLTIEDSPEYKNFVPYYITQIYYVQKKYDDLVPYGEKVLATNPESEYSKEVNRILGECAYRKGNYKKATDYLVNYEKKSEKVQRNDMYMLGVSHYKTENYSAAVKQLAKATTEKDSLAQSAYLYLGNSYIQLNDKVNARIAFQTAAEMDFDPKVKEEAAYNYALSTVDSASPFGESITAFEDFLHDYPNSKYTGKVQENLVNAYLLSKNYEAAKKSLDNMKKLSPEMRNAKCYVLYQLGVDEFLRGNYDKAITQFSLAANEGEDNLTKAQVYYFRGESFYRQEKYDKSRTDYLAFLDNKYAKDYPDYNKANYTIGYTYFQQKQYKDATPYFLKYVNAERNTSSDSYADALDRLGDCYFVSRDLNNAEKYYGMSIAKNSKGADYASFQKAFLLGLKKNYSGKVSGLQKMIADYPNSPYEDNAYYEMARAFVLMNQQNKALETYQTLISKFPQSPLAMQAALEIGMLNYNAGKNDDAISAYKKVVAAYPNSKEAQTALESMEDIYVEKNDVDTYFSYTKTLDKGVFVGNASREDSLSYLAAERSYIAGNYSAAEKAFKKYVSQFCPSGRSCVQAKFYLADCYYRAHNTEDATTLYKELSELKGNPHMETVLTRLSQMAYDAKDYTTALPAFKQLQAIGQTPAVVNSARIGVLRCSYLTNDVQTTIATAKEVLAIKGIDADLAREARFYMAKSYLQIGEKETAQADLRLIAKDLRTEAGAESKYLVADYYFQTGNAKKAEDEINDFINKGTPYRYWLARTFVLLSDIYIQKGDDFQAKQYLISLQTNYTTKDTIQDLIAERLDKIKEREDAKIIK